MPSRKPPTNPRAKEPAPPRPPASYTIAVYEDHSLEDESSYHRMEFVDFDLAGVAAESVEFEECRFRNADFSKTTLERAAFVDCEFESSNLANLKVARSSMKRARLSGVRMTGLQWVDAGLRDVEVVDSRGDLSSFRFSIFNCVTFRECNLAKADFTNADISGARFIDCDLTGAQFHQAKMSETRLVNCNLEGVGGMQSFAGAIVSSHDVLALTHQLATALGIIIDTGVDPA
jgi:uncharacterized protein YjbI with pentapeptide repeats